MALTDLLVFCHFAAAVPVLPGRVSVVILFSDVWNDIYTGLRVKLEENSPPKTINVSTSAMAASKLARKFK